MLIDGSNDEVVWTMLDSASAAVRLIELLHEEDGALDRFREEELFMGHYI